MTDPRLTPTYPKSLRFALWIMSLVGLFALAFVILQSISAPNNELERFSEGSLKKLVVLESPPIQPERKFLGPGGQEMSLADFRGKYVLLNVWATWCPPCIAEIPSLDKLQKERGSDKFEVVAISVDTQRITAEGFLVSRNIEHLKLYTDSTMAFPGDVNVVGLPISIFYDPAGNEVARIPGEVNWQSTEAQSLLRAVIH